jgi:LL-diaminopimelate aminotransferase
VICHDAPYTEVTFDGYRSPSFMQVPAARRIGVEFHSLSKTYNMTGWRIGMVVGNPDMVNALFRVKSNLDSGVPQAIQYAAVEGLRGPQEYIGQRNAIFQQRRDLLVKVLGNIGLKCRIPKATFYVWAKIPQGYTSMDFAKTLLDELAIAVTPGTGYGKGGEGYIRFSLTIPDDRLQEGVTRLSSWRGRA